MYFLSAVVSANIHALVTTRHMYKGTVLPSKAMTVTLQPIEDVSNAATFLRWHIARYQQTNHRLSLLSSSLDEEHLRRLILATGGVPLLMQIVAGHIVRLSWDYLDSLPDLLGSALLDFLYAQAWTDLGAAGNAGLLAQTILQAIARNDHSGRRITFKTLQGWFANDERLELLPESLALLYERFLIINNDLEYGNFAITPTLAMFVSRQQAFQ